MASARGVGGCAAAHSLGAGPSQREASWSGRHEGKSRGPLDGPRYSPCNPCRLHWFMGPVPRRGDAEEPRLGRLRMEGAFTLAGLRLDWGTMVGVLRLVWLGTLRFLGKATLGALGLIHLPVMLQRAVVMLQLNILGMKMVLLLGHLGDTGAKKLHLGLEIDLCRRFPSGGTPMGVMVLSIVAILSRHSRVWSEEEATGPDRRWSQLGCTLEECLPSAWEKACLPWCLSF
ncbi:unnamed protein product [Prunus brigantina]